MGFMDYIKGVKEAFTENKNRGHGQSVNLQASCKEFIWNIMDGGHYLAVDTNFLIQYNPFQPAHRNVNFVVSQCMINAFHNSIDDQDGNSQMARSAINTLNRAMQEGYKISVYGASQEDVDEMGLETSFAAAVITSFLIARINLIKSREDRRNVYLITLPTEYESIAAAQRLNIPTYIAKP